MDQDKICSQWETLLENPNKDMFERTLESTYSQNHAQAEFKDVLSGLLTLETELIDPLAPLPSSGALKRYILRETIAQGGMGTIYKGFQKSLGRYVAIKKLLTKFKKPQDTSRFIAESKVTAFLDHPNIVPVYDLGKTEQGEVLLVMKLIGGTSWKDLLEKERSPSPSPSPKGASLEKQLRILLSVCNALIYAHSKGIIHNDLKPENIMIGEFGEVYVMDWGIAVSLEENSVSENIFLHKSAICNPMGTPCYMAPELAEGKGNEIGPWTDVYLLGAILYEILMQRPPHPGHTIFEILSWICDETEVSFSEDIPQELQAICTRALSKAIPKRYPTVKAFKEEIEDFLQHQESILITQEAKAIFKTCEHQLETTSTFSKQQRNKLYDDYAQAIASFSQALRLWNQNTQARQYTLEARYSYGCAALKNEDFGLAETQIEHLKEPLKTRLTQNLKEAQKEKQRSFITARLSLVALMVFPLAFIGVIDVSTMSYRSFRFMSFYNHPYQIYIFITSCLASSLLWIRLRTHRYELESLHFLTISYHSLIVLLNALMFFQLSINSSSGANGIFPSALWLAIFPVLVPYTTRMSWWSALAVSSMLLLAPCFKVSRPREFHPQPLAERYMNLSIHTAPIR
jgi:serine/threonine protein kinase